MADIMPNPIIQPMFFLLYLIQSFLSIVYTPITENIPYVRTNIPDSIITFGNIPIYYKINNHC